MLPAIQDKGTEHMLRKYWKSALVSSLGLALAIPAHAEAGALVTVKGRVDVAPTCPVQQQGEDCTSRGVVAVVTATHGKLVRKAIANANGFTFRLPPGSWAFSSNAGMRCNPVKVRLIHGSSPKTVIITCDSGIR